MLVFASFCLHVCLDICLQSSCSSIMGLVKGRVYVLHAHSVELGKSMPLGFLCLTLCMPIQLSLGSLCHWGFCVWRYACPFSRAWEVYAIGVSVCDAVHAHSFSRAWEVYAMGVSVCDAIVSEWPRSESRTMRTTLLLHCYFTIISLLFHYYLTIMFIWIHYYLTIIWLLFH